MVTDCATAAENGDMVLPMVLTLPGTARIMNQVQDRRFAHTLPLSVVACVFSDFAIHRHMLRDCSGNARVRGRMCLF